MPNKSASTISSALPAGLDVFQALANTYLVSAERLLALNLSTLRETMEASEAATKSLAEMNSAAGSKKSPAAFAQTMVEKSLAYSRSTYEILAATQQEVTETLMSQVAGSSANLKIPANWSSPFELFAKNLQQFSTLATQSAAATTEASSRALAETWAKAKRAA